ISPSVAATLPVFNNFYDSFANSSQCQPDTNGCCQNPFTFGSQGNRDLTPRGAPFQCTLAG
ncbi:hypothetical protein MRY87_09615, partial [bacterium]|nr:hypothetical protein [bacterium]